MPTYTYVCTKCGDESEAVQSMADAPLKRCKICRGALRRTYHPVGIVLKGSGFHRNDYRTQKPSKSSSSDGDKSEKKTETKSESTGEKKTETSSSDKTSDKSRASSDN